jgi:hypothetical protein
MSPPGVEPGLRPSQGRVPPPHPEDVAFQPVSPPGIEPGPRPSEGRVLPAHPGDVKGRRWGSHPHRPHYECGAFLTRATPAQCVWRELNPAPRGSQPRMQRRYTTDTAEGVGVEPTRPCGSLAFQARPVAKSGSPSVSSPGWNRTTDLLRVGEASWPLDHGTVSTPARSRTRNASVEARHDVRFTTRASSGR